MQVCTCFTGESSHKIPYMNFILADNNYRGMWIQLRNFVRPTGDGDYNPVYTVVRDWVDLPE